MAYDLAMTSRHVLAALPRNQFMDSDWRQDYANLRLVTLWLPSGLYVGENVTKQEERSHQRSE